MIEWQVSVEYPDTSVSMTVYAPTLRDATDLVYRRLTDPGAARPIALRVEGTAPLASDLVERGRRARDTRRDKPTPPHPPAERNRLSGTGQALRRRPRHLGESLDRGVRLGSP